MTPEQAAIVWKGVAEGLYDEGFPRDLTEALPVHILIGLLLISRKSRRRIVEKLLAS